MYFETIKFVFSVFALFFTAILVGELSAIIFTSLIF